MTNTILMAKYSNSEIIRLPKQGFSQGTTFYLKPNARFFVNTNIIK
jgi:hypothetical protein